MARRDSQGDRNIRAVESGANIVHNRENIKERRADRGERARQFDESVNQSNLDRSQRAWESNRKARAERDQQRSINQANKPRTTNFGGEGRLPDDPMVTGDAKFDSSVNEARRTNASQEQLQRDQMGQQQRQFDDRQQLDAAKSGLMQSGGGGASDPRLQQMQQEMERGRQQMGMGVEQSGSRKYVPTPEAQQANAYGAETDRMNAEASRANAMIRQKELQLKAMKLQAEVDGGGGEAASAELRAVNKQQQKKLDTQLNAQIAFSKGKGTDKQWQDIQADVDEAVAKGVGGRMQEIQAEVSRREYGPAVRSFISEGVMTQFVEFVTMSQGRFPEGVIPDVTTEAWQTFTRNGKIAGQMLKSGLNAELYPVTETDRWKRQVNMLAGFLTMSNKGQQMEGRDSGLPMPGRTSQSDVMRGRGGQLQENAQLPGGGTTRRQIPEGRQPQIGKEPIPEPSQGRNFTGPTFQRPGNV